MKPLPAPQPGGKVKDLRRFLNVDDEDDFYPMVAWVLIALRPDGPYPILILTGEQASAKSTTARMLRAAATKSRSVATESWRWRKGGPPWLV